MSWWSQSSKQLFFYQQKTTITIGYLLIIRGGSKNLRQRLRGHPAGSLSSHVGEKAYQSCAGAACAAFLKEIVGVVSSKMFSLSSLISGKFSEFRRHIFSAAEETELYMRCFHHFFFRVPGDSLSKFLVFCLSKTGILVHGWVCKLRLPYNVYITMLSNPS